MTRCAHCGYENNNRYYCAGCGRKLAPPAEGPGSGATPGALSFLAELTGAVERIFPSTPVEESAVTTAPIPAVDLTRMAAADGMVLADGAKWRPLDGAATARAFFTEMLIIGAAAVIAALVGRLFGDCGVVAAVKTYFLTFIALSFVCWVLFPYLFGSSPAAMAFSGFFLIGDSGRSARGDAGTALLLWLVALSYSFFPLLAAEYLYLTLAREHYQPLLFQLAAVRYMKNL